MAAHVALQAAAAPAPVTSLSSLTSICAPMRRYVQPRVLTTLAKAAARLARHAPSGEAYVSRSVPSIAGQRFSKSPSRWSPRSNRAWIRCCASLHVREV